MRAETHRKTFLLIMGALTLLAWLTLWAWGQSPYGQHIYHHLGKISPEGGIGGIATSATLFVAGWTLMTIAMMLPTTLPLVEMFRRLTFRRSDRTWLVALLIGGYVGTWAAFGIVAYAGNWGLQQVIEGSTWLRSNTQVLSAGTLILAGVYQFTPFKYRCLDKCRSPYSFIVEHWRGKGERLQSLLLGAHSGVFCIGCCWSLMLLMFSVSVGHFWWMLVLGAVMAIEKNMPWGRRLVAPIGVALVAWGLTILLNPLWSL